MTRQRMGQLPSGVKPSVFGRRGKHHSPKILRFDAVLGRRPRQHALLFSGAGREAGIRKLGRYANLLVGASVLEFDQFVPASDVLKAGVNGNHGAFVPRLDATAWNFRPRSLE